MKKNYVYLALNVKGFHPYYLNRFVLLVLQKIKSLNLLLGEDSLKIKHKRKNSTKNITGSRSFNQISQVFIPKKRERFTVLRSPHVDKKARDQFERVTFKRMLLVKIPVLSNTTLQLYRFIESLSNLCIGVNLEVKYLTVKK